MVGEAVEKKIYDAAAIGDVTTFQQLLQTNPHLLDVVSFSCLKNALHIAIKHGQESIVEEVLNINTELALELDSKNSSSLHIAAAKGNVEIAKRLLSIAPEMCWWRDCHDMNPIHIAAMKGKVEVLEEMLYWGSNPATERVQRGQTAMHLCVKHHQIETLKVLVEKLGHIACAKDDDGETLLHLAVRFNQLEIVQYLAECNKIQNLTTNSMGKTALNILDESFPNTGTYLAMRRILFLSFSDQSVAQGLPKSTDITMVVAILIATMVFQAAVSPPGGVSSAGKAVVAATHPNIYKHFVRANTTAFISSLITILFITTELPSENFFYLMIATFSVWVSLTSISVSYGASLIMTNPMETQPFGNIVGIVVSVFVFIFVLALLYLPIHYLCSSWKRKLLRRRGVITTA